MNSETKFEYAKKWELIIKQFENRKMTVRIFCKEKKIDCSTLYRNLKKHKKYGFDGLIDKRHGVPYKIAPKIEKHIMEIRIKNNKKSGADIANEIRKQFSIEVSRSQINRRLKKLGLNDPIGRKPGKKILKKQDSI